MLRVTVEPSGQDFWKLDPVVDLINSGAVGVIPTDTVYDMSILSLHFSLCWSRISRWNNLTAYPRTGPAIVPFA
jgi:hypothetical protein